VRVDGARDVSGLDAPQMLEYSLIVYRHEQLSWRDRENDYPCSVFDDKQADGDPKSADDGAGCNIEEP
jgi:hypothetical protein